MMPPSPQNDYEQLAPKPPLSSWEQIDTYGTLRRGKNDVKRTLNEDGSAETMLDFGLFRCVASSNPRLTTNSPYDRRGL